MARHAGKVRNVSDKPTTAPGSYYEAKHALDRAESAWRKLSAVYFRLWREQRSRAEGEAPTEEFLRVKEAYRIASAALTDAREQMRLLQLDRPTRKRKPGKYGPAGEDDD
jgi:hypothetical protein